jgi:hypothetical protein
MMEDGPYEGGAKGDNGVEGNVKTGGPGPKGGSRALTKEDGGARGDEGMASEGDMKTGGPGPEIVAVSSFPQKEPTCSIRSFLDTKCPHRRTRQQQKIKRQYNKVVLNRNVSR